MQKATLKVYLVGEKRPLFKVDIYNNIYETIDSLVEQISSESNYIVKFGEVAFKRELFHHFEYELKK